jgi:hypothetical protein
LAEPECVLLRRLAIFAGLFRLEAAAAVAASPELSVPDVIEGLLGLIAKSLVVAGGKGAVVASVDKGQAVRVLLENLCTTVGVLNVPIAP